MKIVNGQLEADQSALTGESLTIAKERSDLLYSGSVIKRGEADAIVVLTGSRTYFGETTEAGPIARPRLHAEKVISGIVTWLLTIVGVALAVSLAVSALRGIPLLPVLPLALVLLASSIPVALPAMFTISMAIGSLELVSRGVLVTRLSASEDAATMDTLCLDKTGTITVNRLSVAATSPADGITEGDLLMYGALASQEANYDPIDLAFLDAAAARNIPMGGSARDHSPRWTRERGGRKPLLSPGRGTSPWQKERLKSLQGSPVLTPGHLTGRPVNLPRWDTGLSQLRWEMMKRSLKIPGSIALHDPPRTDAKDLIAEIRNLGILGQDAHGGCSPDRTGNRAAGRADGPGHAPGRVRADGRDGAGPGCCPC